MPALNSTPLLNLLQTPPVLEVQRTRISILATIATAAKKGAFSTFSPPRPGAPEYTVAQRVPTLHNHQGSLKSFFKIYKLLYLETNIGL